MARYQTSRAKKLNEESEARLPVRTGSTYDGALSRRITRERVRPNMRTAANNLSSKNVEAVQFKNNSDLILNPNSASSSDMQSFKPQPATSPVTSSRPASNSSTSAPVTSMDQGTDLTSINLSIGQLKNAHMEESARGDLVQATKIQQQIMQLESQKRAIIRHEENKLRQHEICNLSKNSPYKL